jgi:hypothetical protein
MFSQTLRLWRIDLFPEPAAPSERPPVSAPSTATSAEPRSRFEHLRILPRPDDDY